MSSRLCFCNVCKGKNSLTRYKIKQHLKIYGSWSAQKSLEGRPSESSKDNFNGGQQSSASTAGVHSEIDSGDGVQGACFADEDTFMEHCDDFSPAYGCAENGLLQMADDGVESPSTRVSLNEP